MKAVFIKYSLLFLIVWVVSCKGPSPTELLYDESNSELDIEILTPNPDLIDNAPGYDSTGVIERVPESANIITVNGIKTTMNHGAGMDHYYASAMFFDKSDSVKLPNNRLIGYKLRSVGNVGFDNTPAKSVEKRISFLYNGRESDTLLGTFYELRRLHGPMHQRGFPYNSSVHFTLNTITGNTASFDIPTPEEITGEVKLRGSREEKNIQLSIEWNGTGSGKIDIIISGSSTGNTVEPFFKIRTDDDGSYELNRELLRNIPFDRFRILIVTLERTKELSYTDSFLTDNLITGKSIHNIKFNVP